MIEIKNLNKYFNKQKSNQIHVINDVSLSLPASGIIVIFGKSGCGKTTLLNVIGGLDKFESGDVLIDGKSIKKNGLKKSAQGALVPPKDVAAINTIATYMIVGTTFMSRSKAKKMSLYNMKMVEATGRMQWNMT